MLLSAVFVLVVAQSCSDIPEGLMNNPVYHDARSSECQILCKTIRAEKGSSCKAASVCVWQQVCDKTVVK